MARKVLLRVVSLDPTNATAMLEDGREMKLVMSETGSLGLRPIDTADHLAGLDQNVGPAGAPQPVATFDLSGLDQT